MMPHMPKIELGRPATYDDLVALPEHVVGEIVDDELWASPRPAPRHAWAKGQLMAELGTLLRGGGPGGPRGWTIHPEPELHFARQVLVPDLAGWRRDRLPRLPETAFFELAPDWLCEVLSPSTARLDRERKLRVYASAGVGHV
jgi:Uma2 family endonuclease